MPKQSWVPLFVELLKHIRINSKEVPSIDEKGAPLNLWGSQQYALDEIIEGMERGIRIFLILKSRQQGISTLLLALDICWLALHPGTMGALVTESETNRAIFRDTIRRYVESFPKNFFGEKFRIMKDNNEFMLFSNGSRLDFIVAGTRAKKNWGEGRGYALAHCTEAAAYGSEEGLASFRETLAESNPNRLYIYESTAKGMNHYKRMWEEFGRDEFTKKRIFIGWYRKDLNIIRKSDPRFKVYGAADPDPMEKEILDAVANLYGYKISMEQLAWYRWRHSDSSAREEDLWQNQPFTAEQAFVLTGYSYFQMAVLGKEYERCCTLQFKGYKYLMGNDFWEVKCEQIFDVNRMPEITLRVWEEPDDNATYAIGCDPAYGRGEFKNRHAISVFRCFGDRMVQVAEWADNSTGTRQAAWVLAHLAGAYKNCRINVESAPGPGGVIINEVENLREKMKIDDRYQKDPDPNKNWEDFLQTATWYLYRKPDHFAASQVKGWESNVKTKQQMMSQLHDKFVTEKIIIRSVPLVKEMMNVVKDGDSIGAIDPNTDDRVFAMALANRAWVDEIMLSLLAQGDTYEEYLKNPEGEPMDKRAKMMNNIVDSFFKRQAELAENPPMSREQQWLIDRGFA